MTHFQELVERELARARNKNAPVNSLHEGFAVLQEEVCEPWDEVRKKPAKRNAGDVLGECVQIAAMAERIAEDMGYC